MMALLARARFIVGALAVCGVIAFCTIASGTPASAQRGTAVDPDASVVNEQTLLRQFPRIEGRIDIPNETASVLEQPAGRTWDHFHQVTLHWLGAIIILGTIAGLAAAYFILGRIRISAGRSGRKVPRFNELERFVHWLTAVSFIVLGLSGLNITFGKSLLLPLIGPDAFSAFSHLLTHTRTSVAMSYTYVNPLVALLLGSVWGAEHFSWPELSATGIIIAGVVLLVQAPAKSNTEHGV